VDVVMGETPMPRAARGHVAWLAAGGALAVAAIPLLVRGRWLVGLGTIGLTLLALAWYLVPGRKVAFALAAIAISTSGTIASVAGFDLYMHDRYARGGGYNVWGYRGAAIGRRAAGERRVEMLGGSVTFGYGVAADETIPAYLQAALNRAPAGRQPAPIVVANLGWNSEGAYSFQYTLKDYEYLHSDVAILYSGYNDLGMNTQVFRHDSAVFRLTGYLPILQIIPLTSWLRRDTLATTDRGKVVFTPKLSDQYATEAADAALRVSQALERQLGRLVPGETGGAAKGPQPDSWQPYLQSLRSAITIALARDTRVLVVTEPWISDTHVEQQEAVAEMIRTEWGKDPRVRYRNGGLLIDLHDRAMCWDGMHLTAAGNKFVAEWLAPDVEEILR
jgi:lysophospholipase L1-like esterase